MDIKKIAETIFTKLPIRNIIIMESNPDFSDNAKKIFDKLIEDNINSTYKIIWFVNDEKQFNNIRIKNVKFFTAYSISSILRRIIRKYYNYSAKVIIDCNKFVYKVREEQFRIHLTHGNPFKDDLHYCNNVGKCDYILETSEFFKEMNVKSFMHSDECYIDLGYPRNDDLFDNIKIEDIFNEFSGKKVIVWLPTYREHKFNNNVDKSSLPYGLPSINSPEDFEKIDKILEKNNTIILLKLHPAQNKTIIESFNCKNLIIVTDEQLKDKGVNLYKLLATSDALITDYSSIYYDYLLTKNPIGLAIADIGEYRKKFGFLYDYYKTIKGEYIYDLNQLLGFIQDVANNKDKVKEERLKCLNLYHKYCDNKSSDRVYEFIKKYL